jgi:hypothetical protein
MSPYCIDLTMTCLNTTVRVAISPLTGATL